MKIIKRAFRFAGFDIVRIKNSVVGKQPEMVIANPLIGKSKALEALASVGRERRKVFQYFERPRRSTGQMEEIEALWWNKHGELVEQVWVLSDELNERYRSGYVNKAAAFFKEGNKKAKVLDLGCGSGWFGRMIASPELEYVGVDFSETQINIANRKKEQSPNKEHIKYYCTASLEQVEGLNSVTGVVIHAFLHHLYWEDLEKLFDHLKQILPRGCKFYIVEPVFPDLIQKTPEQSRKLITLDDMVSSYRRLLENERKRLNALGKYDEGPENILNEIVLESMANGFFFSPKEVPFRMNEIRSFLNRYLDIISHNFCGVTNLETAQFIDHVTDAGERRILLDRLMPFSEHLDHYLLSESYFELNARNYLITGFECKLKA